MLSWIPLANLHIIHASIYFSKQTFRFSYFWQKDGKECDFLIKLIIREYYENTCIIREGAIWTKSNGRKNVSQVEVMLCIAEYYPELLKHSHVKHVSTLCRLLLLKF